MSSRTNEASRPDPDELLARVEREENQRRRGRLKVFFGAAAGVGKTYAMLLAGKAKRQEGIDVVVGLVETHGRQETVAVLQGLDILPPKLIQHRGAVLREFDLDATLKRHPKLVLVDELAHSNAIGCRHPKRWQDIEELLAAGINVYTTLNVQHLESLNDDINQVTGVQVRETVPDTVFEMADEVELIDLPPDELLQRLKEGKVYVQHQAERAMQNFFRKGNLIALRELSLRLTADRVDAQMQDYRDDHSIRDVWQVGERILVCIGPNDIAERLVRAGKRLAASLHAELIVIYVETPELQRLPTQRRDEVLRVLRLAEQMGAETVTLSSLEMGDGILQFAKSRNVTKIVLGKPQRRGWRRWLMGSIVDTVITEAHNINIYLLGSPRDNKTLPRSNKPLPDKRLRTNYPWGQTKKPWLSSLWALGMTACTSFVAWLMAGRFELANLVMVYLLGVVFIATRFGRGASILASVLSVAAFDFFFVDPLHELRVSHVQYLVTFAIMLLVALIISHLTSNMRSQAKVAAHRERRANVLYALSEELAASRTVSETARIAARHIKAEFGGTNVLLFPTDDNRIIYPLDIPSPESLKSCDLGVAQWVFDHAQIAGQGTDTLPGSNAVFFPMVGFHGIVGVLALRAANLRRVFLPEQRRLLDTFINQITQTIERVRLVESAQVAQMRVESETLRNSLLSAISHDLRTPLASIVGSASTLVEDDAKLAPADRQELSKAIYDEAQRMSNLANNILDMARLDTEQAPINRQWYPLDEIIGGALLRMSQRLDGRHVHSKRPEGLCLVRVDAALIEQVLVNLLDNACKYTPLSSPIDITAELTAHTLKISVADRGPGIPVGEENKLFDKFYRLQREGTQSGVGLGLAICKAIINAHGGVITARNREGGGAQFYFMLPVDELPPEMANTLDILPMSDNQAVIVVIEDDPQICRFLRTSLSVRGFHIIEAGTGEKGLTEVSTRKPDLVILDLGLPRMDGIAVIREIRKNSNVPVIVLSARSQENDKIAALDAGADDYLTKPFGIGELSARIRVSLRHAASSFEDSNATVFTVGELQVDLSRRLVLLAGKEIHLTPIEYRLLSVLIHHSGKVMTHKQLLLQVWGPAFSDNAHYVRIYMGQLRQKLEPDPTHPRYLLTEVGVGYRLCDSDMA